MRAYVANKSNMMMRVKCFLKNLGQNVIKPNNKNTIFVMQSDRNSISSWLALTWNSGMNTAF